MNDITPTRKLQYTITSLFGESDLDYAVLSEFEECQAVEQTPIFQSMNNALDSIMYESYMDYELEYK